MAGDASSYSGNSLLLLLVERTSAVVPGSLNLPSFLIHEALQFERYVNPVGAAVVNPRPQAQRFCASVEVLASAGFRRDRVRLNRISRYA